MQNKYQTRRKLNASEEDLSFTHDLWSPGSRHSSMSRRHQTRRHVPSLREASTLVGEKNLSSHKLTTWFLPTLRRRPEGRYMSHSGGSSRSLDSWVSGGREWTTRRGGGVRGWMGTLIVLRSKFFPLRQPLKRNERIPSELWMHEYEIGMWRGSKTASRTQTRREAGLNGNGREGRCLTVWRLHEKAGLLSEGVWPTCPSAPRSLRSLMYVRGAPGGERQHL